MRKPALIAAFLLVAALVALVAFLARETGFDDPDRLASALAGYGAGPAVALVLAAFVLGGLVAFPVTVLITGTGLLFAPLPAIALASVGVAASAILNWAIGRGLARRYGAPRVTERLGPRARRVAEAIGTRGVLTVAGLRMLPVAPFAVVGVVVGASRIAFLDYLGGTAIGMAPGIVLLPLVGAGLEDFLRDPDAGDVTLLALAGLGWIVVAVAVQVVATRLRSSQERGRLKP